MHYVNYLLQSDVFKHLFLVIVVIFHFTVNENMPFKIRILDWPNKNTF